MIAFVQARMSSRRLPGKVLRPLLGKPIIEYLLESLTHCETRVRTVVLTSTDPSDDPIASFCQSESVECFRGSLEDVAARFLAAANAFNAESFVRISGDSPLLDFRIVDRAVRLFEEQPCDLATNVLVRTFPKGQSVEVIARSALARAYESMQPSNREHVTTYFYRHADRFTIRDFRHPRDCGTIQMAVDTEEDLTCVETCMRRIRGKPWDAGLGAMLKHFEIA